MHMKNTIKNNWGNIKTYTIVYVTISEFSLELLTALREILEFVKFVV